MLVNIGKSKNLTLISGPCAIESEKLSMSIAEHICEITKDLPIYYVFKASFDKANRSSIDSERGIGIEKGLKILRKIREMLYDEGFTIKGVQKYLNKNKIDKVREEGKFSLDKSVLLNLNKIKEDLLNIKKILK